MCGICGYFGLDSDFVACDKTRNVIIKMSDSLTHRGPDGSGYWIDMDRHVSLGHRRLSILDLSDNGKQPMVSKSQRYVISFNGEIYNYLELEQELHAIGRKMKSACDTEVLLEYIDAFGLESTLKKAIGMFGLSVYDREKNELYLARDRFGEKSVYYGWNNGRFVWASELKAIKALPFVDLELDQDSIYLFLKYQYIKAPWSIYKDIRKMLPGQYLVVDFNDRTVSERFYYSLEEVIVNAEKNIVDKSLEECTEELDAILTKTIARQLRADVPVGLFLSSGIDSALTSAIAQRISGGRLKTYSIGSYNEERNEAPLAKEYAKLLGTDHHEYYLDDKECAELIFKLPSMYDEPFAQMSAIPTYLVSKLARRDVTVAVSGDGGDEMFFGYAHDLAAIKYKYFLSEEQHQMFSDVYDFIQYNFKRRAFRDEMLCTRQERVCNYADFGSPKIVNDLNRAMYFEAMTFMESETLVKVDRASMANSLEIREPFLSPEIAEFAFALPEEYKYYHGRTKRILKSLLAKYLPEELFDIPKRGFRIPVDEYLFSDSFKGITEWAFSENTLRKCGFYDIETTKAIINKELAREKQISLNSVVYNVLMMNIWLKENKYI